MTAADDKGMGTTAAGTPFERLVAAWDLPDGFFDVLFNSLVQTDEQAVSRELVKLHKELGKDIFARALLLRKDNRTFWSAFAPLLHAAAQVSPSAEEFLRLLTHFRKEMGDDGAVGLVIGRATEFCARGPADAAAFLDHCRRHPAELAHFIPAGIVGLATVSFADAHERALALCPEGDPTLASSGVFALGLLDYNGHPDQLAASISMLTTTSARSDLPVQISVIRSVGNLLAKNPSAELEGLLIVASRGNMPEQQHWVAHVLHDQVARHAEPWFRLVMSNITSIPREVIGAFSPVDHLLTDMLPKDAEAVLAFLDTWAASQKFSDEMFVFKSLRHALISNPSEMQRFITHWLLSDAANHHKLAANLVGEFHQRVTHDQPLSWLSLDLAPINSCPVDDLEFILRKVLGHCFVCPKEMASLTFSILNRSTQRPVTEQLVRRYFQTVILRNYPDTAGEFLKNMAKKGSARQKRVAKGIQTAVEPYFSALRGLPQLQEFAPSPIHMHKYQLAQAKQMQEAMRRTEDSGNFIFSKLAKKMPMKAGRAFFFKMRTGPSENDVTLTDTTPLREFSVSFEGPRQYSMDPVGCEYNLLIMRTETRKGVPVQ